MIHYSLQNLQEDIKNIADFYKSHYKEDPYSVIGINRGGIIPAAALGYALNASDITSLKPNKLSSLNHVVQSIKEHSDRVHIIMDDICDSGFTLQYLSRLLGGEITGCRVLYGVLIHNIEQKFSVDLYGHQIRRSVQPEWYQFFWEDFAL